MLHFNKSHPRAVVQSDALAQLRQADAVAIARDLLGDALARGRGVVHRMAERLAALGMPIDPAEVFALVREGSAGRPHVAQVMVRFSASTETVSRAVHCPVTGSREWIRRPVGFPAFKG